MTVSSKFGSVNSNHHTAHKEGTMAKKGRLATSLIVVLSALASLTIIACGDSGNDSPACRDGNCGDSGAGGEGGVDACSNRCTNGTTCNAATKQCTFTGTDACGNKCASGTICLSTGVCGTPQSSDSCGGTCGANTYCWNGSCYPSSGSSGGTGGSSGCNPACSSGYTCVSGVCQANSGTCNPACSSGYYCSNGTCVANPPSSGNSVTWRSSNGNSQYGWVDVNVGSDGAYIPNKTATFASSELDAIVCSINWGGDGTSTGATKLTLVGAGEWWTLLKDDSHPSSYWTTQQAANDTAAKLRSWHGIAKGSRPAGQFDFRASGHDTTFYNPDVVGADQSAIDCAYVPASGVVETY